MAKATKLLCDWTEISKQVLLVSRANTLPGFTSPLRVSLKHTRPQALSFYLSYARRNSGFSFYPSVLTKEENHTNYRRRQWHPTPVPLAWKIPWKEEPGGLQSMGSRRVGHDWATSLSLFTFMHWRRKWQPTPVFLPGESQGWQSLVGCRLWGRTESDTTEVT